MAWVQYETVDYKTEWVVLGGWGLVSVTHWLTHHPPPRELGYRIFYNHKITLINPYHWLRLFVYSADPNNTLIELPLNNCQFKTSVDMKNLT